MKDLLLEIGCENLPPHGIRQAFESLGKHATASLNELRLEHKRVYTTGAPRRLVLIVEGLADRQTAGEETVTGPPIDRAFDDAGKPTKAAEGFARSRGVGVDRLRTIRTEKGDMLGITQKLSTQTTAKLLKEEVVKWIAALKFPKLMHWEATDVMFARPIRWLVCLHGDTPIRLSIAGVKSSTLTYTVPWIQPKGIRVRNATQYRQVMKNSGVIVDHDERRHAIETLASKVADREALSLIADPALYEELTFMLEEPKPLVGSFDDKYLSLPAEVVTTAMRSHQRYLAFQKPRGKLVPKFLTFTEGKVGSPSTVRRGNEKVLRARLEDALFYWHEDLKTGMDGLADKLDAIVFIEGLGTLGDKSRRIVKLAAGVAATLAVGDDLAEIERAARLAKADLASEMIKDGKEFTLLQGLIGSYYAKECGESVGVARALRDQYLPRNPADRLPESGAARCLSVADRIDTIAGCLLAGFMPTGSQDPYALRRMANGLIRIVEGADSFSLLELIESSATQFETAGYSTPVATSDVRHLLGDFFRTRVAFYLKEKGTAYDIVDAVTLVAWPRPGAALTRARAIAEIRGDADFERLITGVKRVGNILAAEHKRFGLDWDAIERAVTTGDLGEGVNFDSARFEDAAESALHGAVATALPKLRAADDKTDVASSLRLLSTLAPSIDAYFDSVLVNAKDPALRSNRHHFLAAVFALFSKYADFSCIVESARAAAPSDPRFIQ